MAPAPAGPRYQRVQTEKSDASPIEVPSALPLKQRKGLPAPVDPFPPEHAVQAVRSRDPDRSRVQNSAAGEIKDKSVSRERKSAAVKEKSVAAAKSVAEQRASSSKIAPPEAKSKSAAPAPQPPQAPAPQQAVPEGMMPPGMMPPGMMPPGMMPPGMMPPGMMPPGAMPQMPPGIGAIDPLAVPVPPELGATIYGWVRRLALQADLSGADKVLREALLDITSSLSVTIVYPGADGLWSLGDDEEIPRDAQPLIAVAMARRAVVSSHTAIIPVVTSSETVAVVTLTRNPRNPAYHPIEQIAMIALVREAASILHHLAVQHIQKAAEIQADKGGLYRGEALEAHRARGNEGVPIHLTPGWVRRTYPVLVVSLLIAIVVSVVVHINTYSTGDGIIEFAGTKVMSPAMGAIEHVYVAQGDSVKKGQLLLKLQSTEQEAELAQAHSDLANAQIAYLMDQTDEQLKRQLAAAQTRVSRAQAAVDARTVRAPRAGVVEDSRVKDGQALQIGDQVMTLVEPGSLPEIVAVMPGSDLPRIKKGMSIQIELVGYKKTREEAEIVIVGAEVIGGQEAMRYLGPNQADSLKVQGGQWVLVRGRLAKTQFEADEGHKYHFFHGMPAKCEVRVAHKPFLVSLLPVLEKYFPD